MQEKDITERILEYRGEAEAPPCTTATKTVCIRREKEVAACWPHPSSPRQHCEDISPKPVVPPAGEENPGEKTSNPHPYSL